MNLCAGDLFEDMFVSHGPMFNMSIMYTDMLFTASPEHLKLMLATDFPNYVKGMSLKRISVKYQVIRS